ncbi:MAG: pseudaminic acid cytidylyltransferase [Proteobacteria bacterium]|nr:pseudaminic acid cytidylyltransferase [Pseudomonadota bacterium]MBU1709854.1 pseudaminic acid cytidylyltransferase [Pseudomonadota bacterium]
MNIAIIPARGGSKRIPRKNIKLFAGKPIIAWPIEAAKTSGLFDRIIVSTDDQEIAEVSKLWGAEVPFIRPDELSNDYAGTTEVISHATQWTLDQGLDVTAVCCIYATAPFVQVADLVAGLHMLETNDLGYVFPVTVFPSAIERALRQLPNGLMEPFYNQYVPFRTQDLEPAYYDAGQFYWGLTQTWLEGKIIHKHGAGLGIPSWRVVDIDTIEDWQRAELMFEVFNSAKFPV